MQAELKKLYCKAHPHRDVQTRQEDLVRRFFDGLLDDKARIQVEFVKNPTSIDEAVDAVVAYVETCKITVPVNDRKQRPTRAVHMVAPAPDEEDQEEDEEENEQVQVSSRRVARQNFSRENGRK